MTNEMKAKKVCPKCHATVYGDIEYCICEHRYSDAFEEFTKMVEKGLGKQ